MNPVVDQKKDLLERAYEIAYALFVCEEMLRYSTAVSVPFLKDFCYVLMALSCAVVCVKLAVEFFQKKIEKVSLICMILLGISFAVLIAMKKPGVFMLLGLFSMGAHNIRFEKIERITSCALMAGLVVIIFCAFTGVIENTCVVKMVGDTPKNRMGCGFQYYYMPSHYMFFAVLTWIYRRKEQITWAELAGLFVLNTIIYLNAWTKNPFFLGSLAITLAAVLKLSARIRSYHKLYGFIATLCYPVCMFIITLTALIYNPASEWFQKANALCSGRLKLNADGYLNFGIHLFGSSIEWNVSEQGYNLVDSSYLMYLYEYGVIFVIGLLLVCVLLGICSSRRKDTYYALTAGIIAVYAMFDGWLLRPECNVFLMAFPYLKSYVFGTTGVKKVSADVKSLISSRTSHFLENRHGNLTDRKSAPLEKPGFPGFSGREVSQIDRPSELLKKVQLNDLLFHNVIKNRDIARYLYFAGFGFYLLIRTWDSTMFPRSSLLKALGAVLFFLCIGFKILLCDSFEKKEFFGYLTILAVGLFSFLSGEDIHFAFLCFLVMGSKGISFRDILKEFLLVTGLVFLLALAAAGLGLIEDLLWDYGKTTEFLGLTLYESHALGMIHTTDCAAKVFFLILAAYDLSGKEKPLVFSLISAVMACLVYIVTRGGLDSGCLLILSGIVLLEFLLDRYAGTGLKNAWKFVWRVTGLIAMPCAAIVSLLACLLYNPESQWMVWLNEKLSGRLAIGQSFFMQYPVTLFGLPIEMNGVGGIGRKLLESGEAYAFMDISYQQVLMINGILALLIVVGFYILTAKKSREDLPMLYCISLISLNCMIAHHLTDISYIPFILAFSCEQTEGVLRFRRTEKKENEQKGNERSIRKNYILNMVYAGTTFLFPFLSFKYASGILHPQGTGKVSFATSIITYFNMFAQLGIPSYGIRTIARLRDDRKERSKTATELLLINLCAAGVAFLLLYLSTQHIALLHEERILLFAMSPLILFKAVGMEWYFKGMEEYGYIAGRSILCQLIAFVALFLLVKTESDVVAYGIVTVIAVSAAGIFNFIFFRKRVYMAMPWKELSLRKHLKPILIFFAMTCAVTVYTCLDVAMLGIMKNDTEVGYYDAAVKIKYAISVLITSLGAVVLPRAAYYIKKERKKEFGEIIGKTLSFAIIVSVPAAVFFVLFAGESIELISGPEYKNAVLPMQVIMPALIPIAITNVTGMEVLVPTGREKKVLYSTIAGVVVDLGLNLLLIPSYGAAGAALGTLAAEIAVLLCQLYALREDLRTYLKELPWAPVIVATVAGSIGVVLCRLLISQDLNCVVRLALGAAVFGGLYGLTMFAFCRKQILELIGCRRFS